MSGPSLLSPILVKIYRAFDIFQIWFIRYLKNGYSLAVNVVVSLQLMPKNRLTNVLFAKVMRWYRYRDLTIGANEILVK